jgi:hypothetical protein
MPFFLPQHRSQTQEKREAVHKPELVGYRRQILSSTNPLEKIREKKQQQMI